MFGKLIRFLGLATSLAAMLHVFVIIMNMVYGEEISGVLIVSSISLSGLGLLLCFAAWREIGQLTYLVSSMASILLLLASILAEIRPGNTSIYVLGSVGILLYLGTIYSIIYSSMK